MGVYFLPLIRLLWQAETHFLARKPVRIVVATSVALSFISFWRAGAIVLNDLGSSAFYAGGIAGQAFGKSAPWLILAVMLFAFAVRMVYMESCVMFVRGGVYRVVKEGMGPTLAKLGVSALLFDYILTGPISVVSAGQYLTGLVNDTYVHFVHPASGELAHGPLNVDLWSMVFAIGVTIYFWRQNTIGIHESSEKALRIMYAVTALVVIASWSGAASRWRFAAGTCRRCRPPPTCSSTRPHSGGCREAGFRRWESSP